MKKLRICLVSLTVAPDSMDGEAKVIKAHFDYLKKQGHDVKLITGKWSRSLEDLDIIQVNIMRKRFFWLPLFTLKVMKYLRTHDFDIIHGNSAKAALPIVLSRQKKFLTTIHDLGPFEKKLTAIPLEKFLIKHVVKRASMITTVSNFVKKQFPLYMPWINREKVHAIYNGISAIFKPYPSKARELKERLRINGPVLLYVGRIATFKGVGDIIKAYKIVKKEIKDLNLIIGGTPDFMMEKTFKEWKHQNKDIHFMGFIPDLELPYYYSMADLFITYSYSSEGFGLTPIEAIACGTPVICSSLLVFREILQDHALFVPPRSPTLLAEEIVKFFGSKEKEMKSLNSAQEFMKRYTWDAVGKRLEDVYSKVLDL